MMSNEVPRETNYGSNSSLLKVNMPQTNEPPTLPNFYSSSNSSNNQHVFDYNSKHSSSSPPLEPTHHLHSDLKITILDDCSD